MRSLFACCLMTVFTMTGLAQSYHDKTAYVNPMIGTEGMGHTFPGACAPFGIVQLSPDTDTIPHNVNGRYQGQVYDYCAGYQHTDNTIVGFSHTHLSGTGHSDLGDILLMPQTGKLQLNPGTKQNPDGGYRQRFSHDTEIAHPGYYEVMLADNGIRAELTATQRVGIHRYTFPKGADQRMIVDLVHGIYNYDGKVLWSTLRVENDTLLTGYRLTDGWARSNYTYFAVSFSKPIRNYGYRDRKKETYNGFWGKFNRYQNFPDIAGRNVVAYFEFDKREEQLEVKVALSAVSTEGAKKNLVAEAQGKDFETIKRLTNDAWERELSVIDCQGSDNQKAMLYTSLYHTMINPSIYEFTGGNIINYFLHIDKWDYSNFKYHFGKYLCLRNSLIWGLLAIIIIYFIHPYFDKYIISTIPNKTTILIIIIFSLDLLNLIKKNKN